MPAGRPTKLTKTLLKQAEDYLVETSNFLPASLLPTVEGLAIRLGISRDSVYEWATHKDDPLGVQFSDILGKLKAMQGEKLIQKSLAGQYNSTIAKLLLSSKHDYVEKSATDLTTAGKELPAPILGGVSKTEKPFDQDDTPI